MHGEQLGSKMGSTLAQYELLTPAELAERLKVPVTWVREQTRSRALDGDVVPHLRLGRYIRFQWGSPELEAWLKRRTYSKSLQSSVPVC